MAKRTSKSNKNNEIYYTIRNDIINGRYPGGTFLVEGELCEEFGVSRTPVREALIRLENDQFIKLIPNRGAYVPHVTLNDIIELYQLRKANDGLAAWLSVERQTPDLVEALEHSVEREAALIAQGGSDPQEVSREDFVFHDLLVSRCGNRRLIDIIDLIQNQMKRIVVLSADQYAFETLTVSLDYHRKIVEAFHENDCAKAKAAIEDHWIAMIEGYISRDLQGRMPYLL